MFPGLAAALPHMRSGRMRRSPSPASSATRSCKDVPTIEEVGFKGFDAMQWYGSVGPAGMPADVVQRLNETQVAVLKAPDLAREARRRSGRAEADDARRSSASTSAPTSRAGPKLAKARNIQLDEMTGTMARNTQVAADHDAPAGHPHPRALRRRRIRRAAGATPSSTRRTAPSCNWVGCAIGAARHEAAEAALAAVADARSRRRRRRVLGRSERVDMASAALVNGITSHTFDFDDTHLKTIIHPAGPVASARARARRAAAARRAAT